MNFKKKYLKYKSKYINLKILKGGSLKSDTLFKKDHSVEQQILDVNKNFLALHNDGQDEGFRNACMWISIKAYLNNVLGFKDITITELRAQSGLSLGQYEEFDTFLHKDGLEKICLIYHLKVNIIPCNSTTGELSVFDVPISNGKNEINIVSYGGHYELILYNNVRKINIVDFFEEKKIYLNQDKYLVYDKDKQEYVDLRNLRKKLDLFENDKKDLLNQIKNLQYLKDSNYDYYSYQKNEVDSNIKILDNEISILQMEIKKIESIANDHFKIDKKLSYIKVLKDKRDKIATELEDLRKTITLLKNEGNNTRELDNQLNKLREDIQILDIEILQS